jgi:copper(I)-binding protein
MAGDGHEMGMTSAVYFVLRNRGSQADRLVGASTAAAGRVELHETRQEGDMMRMTPVQAVEIPPGGEVVFKPGGLHVMLMDLKRDLKVGDSFELTLKFERAGDLTVTVAVREGGT